MSSNEDKREVLRLYDELSGLVENEDFGGVVKTADAILKICSDESALEALQCKLVALLQSNRFDEAIQTVNKCASPLKKSVMFEKAYAQYRLQKLEDCLATLTAMDAGERNLERAQHLYGQVLYRLGRYADSARTYEDLSRGQKGRADNHDLLYTNLVATYVQAGDSAAVMQHLPVSEDDIAEDRKEMLKSKFPCYELAFNAACSAIANGDFARAEVLLDIAWDMGRSELAADELEDAEIDDELANVKAQLAYVYTNTKRSKDAEDVYNGLQSANVSDKQVAVVVSNNLAAMKPVGRDLFTAYKKVGKNLTNSETLSKLTPEQRRTMALNSSVLYMLMNKEEDCKRTVQELKNDDPTSDVPCIVLAALHYRQRRYDEAKSELDLFIREHNDEQATRRVYLTLAQVCLAADDIAGAIAAIEGNETISTRPAFVSLLAHLYSLNNDVDGAARALNAACEYWQQQLSSGNAAAGPTHTVILREAGRYAFANKRYADAAKHYEMLMRVNPGNAFNLAQLVVAMAHVDSGRAEQYAAQLPQLPALAGKSIDDLENLRVTDSPLRKKRSAPGEGPSAQEVVRAPSQQIRTKPKKPKKKKVKPETLKNYEADRTPDPDRWMPKRERLAKQRGRGRRGRRNNNLRGPQGSVADDVDLEADMQKQAESAPSVASRSTAMKSRKGPKGRRRR